ncbi:MAG: RidA family protein [Flavobacterium sp.]|nr:MAG: RidA family protein [Flavobacterium sp.]
MISRKNFNSKTVPRFSDAFPQAVVTGDFVFVSGTVGVDPVTGKLPEGFEQQATQAFLNIQTILEELGSSLDKIVKTTVFMVSGNDFGVLNTVYKSMFPDNAPARSTPQVMPFPGGVQISVECIAML